MSELLYTDTLATPQGVYTLVASERGLREIHFPGWEETATIDLARQEANAVIDAAKEQLTAYFAGTLQTFDLPRDPVGTAFQCAVWDLLVDIPYGSTETYGTIAQRVGRPTASRAVGAANGQNPLPIVVPCHRVIGANGTLTGYAGGVALKESLLDFERRHAPKAGLQLGIPCD